MPRFLVIKEPGDFGAGASFTVAGAAIVWQSTRYGMGSLLEMGPGLYPIILGSLLLVIGSILLGRGLSINGPKLVPSMWSVLALVAIPVAAFGWLLQNIGLVATTVILVLTARLASSERRYFETLVLALGLAAFVTIVFVYGLKLPLLVWPWDR